MYRGSDYSNAFLKLKEVEKDFYLSEREIGCVETPCYSYWNGIGVRPQLEGNGSYYNALFQMGRTNLDILLLTANDLMQKLENFIVLMSVQDNSYDLCMRQILGCIERIEKKGYDEGMETVLLTNLSFLVNGITEAKSNIHCIYGAENPTYQQCISNVLNTISNLQSPCQNFLARRKDCLLFRCGTTIPDYAIAEVNAVDRFFSASNRMKESMELMRAYVNEILNCLQEKIVLLQQIIADVPAHQIQETKQSVKKFDDLWKEMIEYIKS